MPPISQSIHSHLMQVSELRRTQDADPDLAERVRAIKQHQHERFSHDYADLLCSPRYEAAIRFFLHDLYGPADFGDRDAQFGRIVPAMTRLLPAEVMHTVAELAELHALSESLDQQMALSLESDTVDARSYRAAWQLVGRGTDRERQLALLVSIGGSLDRHTRTPWLATTLRLMRGPAKVAGLSRLQAFLENGLAAFAAMGGAQEFLDTVSANERCLVSELYSVPTREKPSQ